VAVTPALSFNASVGQSFRPPALIEIGCASPTSPCPLPFALGDDPPIAPVVATTYEVGGQWKSGTAELTISAYRTDVRDEIFLFPYDEDEEPSTSTIDGYFGNLSRTRRTGLEIGAHFTVGGVAVTANHTITRATFQVDGVDIASAREEDDQPNVVSKGDRLPLVPSSVSSIEASRPIGRSVIVGVGARHTGERYLRGDEANDETPLPAYWLFQVRAQVAIGSWELEGILYNVFDAEYQTFGTYNFNQLGGNVLERFVGPGEPRAFQVTLRRRFGTPQ
jgi:outer membrane cobalamin receptor